MTGNKEMPISRCLPRSQLGQMDGLRLVVEGLEDSAWLYSELEL